MSSPRRRRRPRARRRTSAKSIELRLFPPIDTSLAVWPLAWRSMEGVVGFGCVVLSSHRHVARCLAACLRNVWKALLVLGLVCGGASCLSKEQRTFEKGKGQPEQRYRSACWPVAAGYPLFTMKIIW
jgi:hypothetical protein